MSQMRLVLKNFHVSYFFSTNAGNICLGFLRGANNKRVTTCKEFIRTGMRYVGSALGRRTMNSEGRGAKNHIRMIITIRIGYRQLLAPKIKAHTATSMSASITVYACRCWSAVGMVCLDLFSVSWIALLLLSSARAQRSLPQCASLCAMNEASHENCFMLVSPH